MTTPVARAVGFVSRAQAGLKPPRSVSRNVNASRGGIAVHYGGSGTAPIDHARCVTLWRAWQTFHMQTRGWVDIAYNFGFCNHGYVFAGRGLGVRSAAQGTNDGNDRFLAAVWLGGASSQPTKQAEEALAWIILEARNHGVGREVRPHRYFHSTSCPGGVLTACAESMHNTTVSKPAPPKPPVPAYPKFPLKEGKAFAYGEQSSAFIPFAKRLAERGWDVETSGKFGPKMKKAVLAFQAEKKLKVDGLVGEATWKAAWTTKVT